MMDRDTKREVAEAYDALGGRIYDLRYAEEQESKYRLLLERIRPEAADVVLDVGCGTGLLLKKLDSNGVGLDVSSGLLSAAKSRIDSPSKCELVQADAENMPFRDSVFHKTYSVTLIQNIPRPEEAVIEMRRVSRSGSQLAITALKKAFSEDEFKSILDKSGFKSTILASNDELKDWVAFVVS